jgi:cytosine/adenosine deaminase-related metal-dependent hydrolase
MKLLKADYILSCDESFNIYRDSVIVFDEKIIDLCSEDEAKKRFTEEEIEYLGEGSLIMPGLINVHVHLEFSANKTSLIYGDFISWLKSVIEHREELIKECEDSCMDDAISAMLRSGTTTIGAVSSYGFDLEPCVKSPINVIYFNEVLGSNPAAVDTLFEDFYARLQESKRYKSDSFTPAISIHSPYSTHPILAKKALSIAKDEDMVVSTHFMESKAERDWIDNSSGDFKEFFQQFLPNARSMTTPVEYIELFRGVKTLFTHATHANDKELDLMQEIGTITHSPRSNRLLGNGRLAVEKLDSFTTATDGLSSNNSLRLWDELRSALFLHYEAPLEEFSKKLIRSVTIDASKSLDLNKGVLEVGRDSDLALYNLPFKKDFEKNITTSLILHTNEVQSLYIGGKKLK